MKKIIVSTDFSNHSALAIPYAQAFTKILDASLHVVHVWYPDMNVDDPKEYLHKRKLEEQEKAMKSFLLENGLPPHEGEVKVGFPEKVLVELSKSDDVVMMVMGKKGHGTALEKIIGSVPSILAKEAHCPVLLTPGPTPWKGQFKNIMVAAGVEATDEKSLQRILKITEVFKATVHFVHIKKELSDNEGLLIEDKLLKKLLAEKEEEKIGFNLVDIPFKNVVGGLNQYAEENNIGLVIMVSRHRKWWSDLFHKSKTMKVALVTELPLLAMHLDDR